MKQLTKQEILSIPHLRTKGLTNPQIATRLGVKTRTIQNWASLLRKKGINVPKDKKRKIIDTIQSQEVSHDDTRML